MARELMAQPKINLPGGPGCPADPGGRGLPSRPEITSKTVL